MSVSSVSSKDAKYDLEKSPAKVVVSSSEITEAHDGVNRSNGAFAKVCPLPYPSSLVQVVKSPDCAVFPVVC